jgi:hypothetical protein
MNIEKNASKVAKNACFRSAIIMYGTELGLELLNKCGYGSGSYADPEFPSLICSTFFIDFLHSRVNFQERIRMFGNGSGHLGTDPDIWERIRTFVNGFGHLGTDSDIWERIRTFGNGYGH